MRRAGGGSATQFTTGDAAERMPLLDGWRGWFALWIVAVHCTGFVPAALQHGPADPDPVWGPLALEAGGVFVCWFFAMSAFVLWLPFLRAVRSGGPPPALAAYFVRRAARILPVYWLLLAFFAMVDVGVVPGLLDNGAWWRQAFLLRNFWEFTYVGGIPPAWTICIEAQFYLALPLMAWALRKRTVKIGVDRAMLELGGGLMALGLLIPLIALRGTEHHLARESLLGHLHWFAIGMLIAGAHELRPDLLSRLGRQRGSVLIPLLVLVALFYVAAPSGTHYSFVPQLPIGSVARVLLSQLLAAYLIALTFSATLYWAKSTVLTLVGGRLPLFLGAISYPLYLLHVPVIQALQQLGRDHLGADPRLPIDFPGWVAGSPIATMVVATLAIALPAAALLRVGVELPFMRLARTLSRRLSHAPREVALRPEPHGLGFQPAFEAAGTTGSDSGLS